MTGEEICKYAASGVMPEGMNCAERSLYWEVKDSYRSFRAGEITKTEGEKQKKDALQRFKVDSDVLTYAKKIVEFNGKMWKEIEIAGSAYRLEPSIEKADAFIEAVYGVKRREESRDG